LHARGISFGRTRTQKESRDPDRDAKLDRIEYVTSNYPDRCLAFGQFGPLSIRPVPRDLPGAAQAPGEAARDVSPHSRHPLFPRLLRPGR
jgi:hypothetical protein